MNGLVKYTGGKVIAVKFDIILLDTNIVLFKPH